MAKRLSLAALWPDTHAPYESTRACELVLKVLEYANSEVMPLKELIIMGDFADFYSVNSHGKDPDYVGVLLSEEVAAVNGWLNRFDKIFPKTNKFYVAGNHEFRLDRFIAKKAYELFKLVDCESLFRIKQRKRWKWIDYAPDQRHRVLDSDLHVRHEPFSGGAGSARLTALKGAASIAYGHLHRIESFQGTGFDGRPHIAFCPGWLGGKDEYPEIYSYVRGIAQWSQGFALVWVDQDTKQFWYQIIPIIDYKCVAFGRHFQS